MGQLELSQAPDMGRSMNRKTPTLIIRHPCHRQEIMRVELNVNKSAGWLEIGMHHLAHCHTVHRHLEMHARRHLLRGSFHKPSLADKLEITGALKILHLTEDALSST